MPEEAKSTGIVVIFRSRTMIGVEAFLFGIPKGPSKSTLVIEQYPLLMRQEFKLFLRARLSRTASQRGNGPIVSFHKEVWGISHEVLRGKLQKEMVSVMLLFTYEGYA